MRKITHRLSLRATGNVQDGRIPGLDGWRGIAILLVLIDHVGRALHLPWTPLGTHGVTIFFVLSGFLITSRLISEQSETGRVNLRDFYLRRFFRLMPCAWLYLFLAFLVAPNHRTAFHGTVAALFFYRNMVAPSDLLTGHFWSLSIEEQFYLVWPGLLIFAGRTRAAWVAAGCAIMLAAYRISQWSLIDSQDFIYSWHTQFRADALLVGCIAALTLPQVRVWLRSWMIFPLSALLVYCFVVYPLIIPLHESVVIGLLIMITSSCSGLSLLSARPLRVLGIGSYSIYVWQQPFMFLNYTRPIVRFIAPLSLVLVACGSFFLIERPIIRWYQARRRNHARPRTMSLEVASD